MNRTQYIFLTSILLLLAGCGKHPMPDSVGENMGNRPIEFGISSDLSVESKAIIDGGNVTDYGFMVQAGLTVGAWKTNTVFETGTVVTHGTDGWGYSPARYWQTGSYVFAGAMPTAAGFTGVGLATADGITSLTLDFGTGGYNLAEGQHDLMVAFETVDVQSTSSVSTVELSFAHQLALVVIKGASIEANTDRIRIDRIKVYGNRTSTTGDMLFSYPAGTYSYELTGNTSAAQPYRTYSRPTGTGLDAAGDWQLVRQPAGGNPVYDILVPDLLVFPEECSFTIEVTYTDFYEGNEITITKKGTKQVDWEVGKRYTYSFAVSFDDIVFSEPTVEPWPGTSQKLDNDIEM